MSAIPPLAQPVRQFIKKHVQSAWNLELILFIRNAQSASVNQIAKALYMNVDSVRAAADTLVEQGVLEMTTNPQLCYRIKQDQKVLSIVDETSYAYVRNRVAVIDFIYSKSMQSSTDSFIVRKPE